MEKDFRFNMEEAAGALGDFGTLLPIVIGVSVATDMNLAVMLLFFGIAYLFTGIHYKLPMPVEPMKAIGVIALTERLSAAEIAGAGIGMGLVLLLIALTGAMDFIKRSIPIALIRGIQLALALTLMRQAMVMMRYDFILGALAMGIIFYYRFSRHLDVSALMVFLLGIIVGLFRFGPPPVTLMRLPALTLPDFPSFISGFTKASLPQIPLTLGNAVLATSLLISDLLDRQVQEKQLLYSMSAMCLFSVPFGGFPMCHGAGGLAAQYRFGARTGGSNIISGFVLIVIALLFASPHLEMVIPFGALGALLFYSGLALFQTARKTPDLAATLLTGILSLFLGITWSLFIVWVWIIVRKKWNAERG
ncbi:MULTISPECIES: putative sulfate/molybdate transporter [Anoxynatronum]|uniref:Molybdate transporter of MFS superfamily protein n=2 Tax=Anoxynatronum TaxID=210622 RepID=A0AA46AHJ8_9CLOT|nr:putative sulfate/molybdate transporter [Anoxynatronum buryatiense]SMP39911.1 Molybdate transporter of MFS superfamily protein [Anoxynatronum buryatiense]